MITAARYIREQYLRMSQTRLATELGISQPMISKWEKEGGKIPECHVPKVKELALARGHTLEDADFIKLPMRKKRTAKQ